MRFSLEEHPKQVAVFWRERQRAVDAAPMLWRAARPVAARGGAVRVKGAGFATSGIADLGHRSPNKAQPC